MTAVFSEVSPDRLLKFHPDSATSSCGYIEPSAGAFNPIAVRAVRKSRPSMDALDSTEDHTDVAKRPIEFAHACEAEFARLLDAHEIPWRYKPRTFSVEWDDEGNFIDCFTPDFYLPGSEVYIALLTPERTASAKVRKVKLLRDQHPEIRIEFLRALVFDEVETRLTRF